MVDVDTSVKLTTLAEHFLPIPGKDAFPWAEALWIENDWRLGERYVRAVEVARVHVAIATVTHEELVLWE